VKDLLAQSWWMFAWRGAVALLFGILAILWPGLTLLWLVAMFAAYALLGGGFAIVGAIKNRQGDRGWWLILLLGLVSLAAGVIAIFNPGLTALMLVLLMGANALITGVLEVVMAIRLRKLVPNEWLLILSGAVSIIFGALVLVFPGAGALALVWLISFYAVLSGVLLLAVAFRLKGWGSKRKSVTDNLQSAH
jgi:uncharacterized membrane protein HdeD (DUF308 family)